MKDTGLNVPVLGAGGIFSGKEAVDLMEKTGASGIQAATRFTIAQESGLPDPVKQVYIDAKDEDVEVNHASPTGYLMRMLKNSPALTANNRPNCESYGYMLSQVDSFKSTLDEVREADLLLHIVDISHPDFEEQIEVVNKTLADIGAAGKPMILVFNKIDAYTYIEKAADDLTPRTKENLTLEELMKTWMAKMEDNCLFISAREKINMEELKSVVYQRVKELHVQKYPYNDFLYQTYEEEV